MRAAAVEDLAQVGESCVSLKIYACKLLPGTELGCVLSLSLLLLRVERERKMLNHRLYRRQGLLYTKDVAIMDRQHPVAVFTWQYASHKHLAQLGVLPESGASLTASWSSSPARR